MVISCLTWLLYSAWQQFATGATTWPSKGIPVPNIVIDNFIVIIIVNVIIIIVIAIIIVLVTIIVIVTVIIAATTIIIIIIISSSSSPFSSKTSSSSPSSHCYTYHNHHNWCHYHNHHHHQLPHHQRHHCGCHPGRPSGSFFEPYTSAWDQRHGENPWHNPSTSPIKTTASPPTSTQSILLNLSSWPSDPKFKTILWLQPREKVAMLGVNTIIYMKIEKRIAFVLGHQHGRRDVTCKPAQHQAKQFQKILIQGFRLK